MNLFELFTKKRFEQMMAGGYIDVVNHPQFDWLSIISYTKHAQLDRMWNEVTMNCRGVIIDNRTYDILYRGFEKFFNQEELEGLGIKVPELPFEAYEKLDGSLGIMYFVNDVPYIATKGSFQSDQAIHATKIVQERYGEALKYIDKTHFTYLFEIIYPENKIVVEYGDVDDIFMTGMIDNVTGLDISPSEAQKYIGHIFKFAKRYDGLTNWRNIREEFSGENREGFVVRFSNGFRMKMKYEDYFRKHFLKSYLTEKHVFDFYCNNKLDELRELMKEFDEENQMMIEKMLNKFDFHYNRIKNEAMAEFKNMGYEVGTPIDKEIAERIKKECKHGALVFRLVRDQSIELDVMNLLKREIKFLEDEIE